MTVRILVRQYGCSLGVQPFISVRVIEVPMRTDKLPDWLVTQASEGFQDPGPRCGNPSVNEKLPVRSCEDGDIAARSLEYAQAAPQGMDSNRCLGCIVADYVHDTLRLPERLPRA